VLDVDGATVAIVEDFVIGVTALAKNVFNGIRFDFVVVNTTEPVVGGDITLFNKAGDGRTFIRPSDPGEQALLRHL
jgi:hypothetical protein